MENLAARSLQTVILSDLDEKVLAAMESFVQILAAYDIKARAATATSIADLINVPDEVKLKLIDSFELWGSWFAPQANEQRPVSIDILKEKEFAQKALGHFGMRVPDEFWATVEKDQLIEIYGPDMIQLYRNLNFFKMCGYSLLEISLYQWYHLWERPTAILKEMMEMAQAAMDKHVGIRRYQVPLHVLRETKREDSTEGFQPRSFLVSFQYIASLRRGLETAPAGAIVTSTGSLISDAGHVGKVSFL